MKRRSVRKRPTRRALNASSKRRVAKEKDLGEISVGGFLKHLSGSEEAGRRKRSARRWKSSDLTQLPRLLDRAPYLQGAKTWSSRIGWAPGEEIENQPERLLFQLTEEIDDKQASHPNASRRILFLWRNREEYALRGEPDQGTASPAPLEIQNQGLRRSSRQRRQDAKKAKS